MHLDEINYFSFSPHEVRTYQALFVKDKDVQESHK